MKRSTLPARSPLTREKGQQNQESRQPAQRDKSTKSVQETVINKTVSNQGSKGVNIIQGKTFSSEAFAVILVIWSFGQNRFSSVKIRHYIINILYLYIVSQMTESENDFDQNDLDHFDRVNFSVKLLFKFLKFTTCLFEHELHEFHK
jgi:hypothetical protein